MQSPIFKGGILQLAVRGSNIADCPTSFYTSTGNQVTAPFVISDLSRLALGRSVGGRAFSFTGTSAASRSPARDNSCRRCSATSFAIFAAWKPCTSMNAADVSATLEWPCSRQGFGRLRRSSPAAASALARRPSQRCERPRRSARSTSAELLCEHCGRDRAEMNASSDQYKTMPNGVLIFEAGPNVKNNAYRV